MAGNVNQVILVGRLGKTPELRYTNGGTAVCTVSLATNRWRSGEKSTDWHRLVCWGERGEALAGATEKGSMLRVTGSIEYREWKPEGSSKRQTVAEINVRDWEELDEQANRAQETGEDPDEPPPPEGFRD